MLVQKRSTVHLLNESIKDLEPTPPTESGVLFGQWVCGAASWLAWVRAMQSMGGGGDLIILVRRIRMMYSVGQCESRALFRCGV